MDGGAVTAGYGEGPGWVPVKRAHLVGKEAYLASLAAREASEAALRASSAPAAATAAGGGESAAALSGNKRRRGQNKGRSNEDKGLTAGLPASRLCRSLLGRGFECRFGAGACRDGHDVAAYLAAKPVDLPGTCPVWAALGDCAAGVTCRWHGSHPAPTDAAAAAAPPPPPRSINVLPAAVQRALQRGGYGFVLGEEGASESWAPGADGGGGGGGGEGPPPASIRASLGSARAAALERPPLSLAGAVVVAPLTTVGNLPFRRIMKRLGADVTIGEMAVASNLCAGAQSEWALLRRHPCEDVFGVQLAGSRPWEFAQVGELMAREGFEVDFVDINCGCPLDLVCNKGMGAAAMGKLGKLRDCVVALDRALGVPVTVKMRTGLEKAEDARFAHKLIGKARLWCAARSGAGLPPLEGMAPALRAAFTRAPLPAAITVHGRTRQQRYSSTADWAYIARCAAAAGGGAVPETVGHVVEGWAPTGALCREATWEAWGLPAGGGGAAGAALRASGAAASHAPIVLHPPPIPLLGNGDVLSWQEWYTHLGGGGAGGGADALATCMLARGALIKPWLPTEIKERRDWDISSGERLDILRDFVAHGLEHWGSDQQGVNHTRRFLLEWLSFLHRYVPVGLMERLPLRMADKAPAYTGRNDLETLMASSAASDWVKISELLLGPAPPGFAFVPKHKSAGVGTAEGAALAEG